MREYNHNARITKATLLALLLGAYLYSADTSAEGAVREISRVNGHIDVERGEQVANVSTVNGSIEIAGDASAARVSTVNGGIDIGQASRIDRAETVNGDITLAADTHKGTRPSFSSAAPPQQGKTLFDYVVDRTRSTYPHVSTGVFSADMKVQLVNDGPVTFWLQV